MELVRCEGSHLRCVAPSCGCPCHRRSEVGEPTRRTRRSPRPRLKELPVKQVLAAFDAGKPPTTIARWMHVRPKRIQDLLLANGRQIKKYRPLPAKTIREERQQGETISALARKFNCDRRTVHRILGNGPKRKIPPPGANK